MHIPNLNETNQSESLLGTNQSLSILFDIAILVLEEEIVPNEYVDIVNLPEADAACPKGKKLIVSGWGLDGHNRTKHNQLWAVYQECLPLDRCAISEEQKGQMLCVGDSEQPRNSACMGDSGGNNIVDIVLQRKGIFSPLHITQYITCFFVF